MSWDNTILDCNLNSNLFPNHELQIEVVRVWFTPRPRFNPDHPFTGLEAELPPFTPPVLMLVRTSLQYNLIEVV